MNQIILYFAATMIVSSPFAQNNNIKTCIIKKEQSVIPMKDDQVKTWAVNRPSEPLVHDGGAILPDKNSKAIDITAKSNDVDTVNVAGNEPAKNVMALNK
jgi:hypothetical protein